MISNGTLCVCPKPQQCCRCWLFIGCLACVCLSVMERLRRRERGWFWEWALCLIPSCPGLVPAHLPPRCPLHKGSAWLGFCMLREGVRLAVVLVARACFRIPLPKCSTEGSDSKSTARTLGAEHKVLLDRVALFEVFLSSLLHLFSLSYTYMHMCSRCPLFLSHCFRVTVVRCCGFGGFWWIARRSSASAWCGTRITLI